MEKKSPSSKNAKGLSPVLRSPLLWVIVALIAGGIGYDFVRPNLTVDGLYGQIALQMRKISAVPPDAKAVEKVFRLCNKIVSRSIDESKKAEAYRMLAGFDPRTGNLLNKPRMEMLLKAADCGDSEACATVGKAYMYGRDGLACDLQKAIAYLERSNADEAKAELGAYYMRQKNYDKAYETLKEYDTECMAVLGVELRFTMLGLLYYYGLGGVERNPEKAAAFFGLNSIPLTEGRTDIEPERTDYDDLEAKRCLCCGNLSLSPTNMGYFSMSDKIDGGGFVPRIYMAHEFFTKAIRLEPETNLGTLLSILDSFLDMYEEYMRDGVQTKKLLNGLWNDRFLRRTGKTLGTSTSGGYWGELKNSHPDGWGIECSYNHMESGKIHSVTIGRRKVAYIREKFGWTAVIIGPSVRSEISKDGTTLTVSVVE